MTIVVDTDEYGARRLEANLYKLVPVRRVENLSARPSIARDLALIKVDVAGDTRAQVMQLVDVYRARVIDVSPESLVIEATGTEDKIESLLEVLKPYGISEMVRTGIVCDGPRHARGRRRRAASVAADDPGQPRELFGELERRLS